MPSELSIRFVTRGDYEQWLPLWDGYNAFYGRSGATALAPEITHMTWARFFDAYEPVHGLVAEGGGELDLWSIASCSDAISASRNGPPPGLEPAELILHPRPCG
jgi:hypothetical protein